MAKKKATKRKVVPTKSTILANDDRASLQKDKVTASLKGEQSEMVFKKQNFMYILGGILLMFIGFLLMSGGYNEDPNVFDEDVIYSTRRTLIAPIFILAGLVVQVFAIFKK